MRLDEGEAFCRPLLFVLGRVSAEARNRFARDDLEPGAGPVSHEAAVDTDIGRPVRQRQLVELALADRPDSTGVFGAGRFISARHRLQVPADPFRCDWFAERQRVTEHTGGKPVGDERAPTRFEIEQLWSGSLGQ